MRRRRQYHGDAMDTGAWDLAFEAFLRDADSPWSMLREWAQAQRVLPIYCEWFDAFGVTRSSELLKYTFDPRPGAERSQEVVRDIVLRNVALRQGALRYPWLVDLFPVRPDDAVRCPACRGGKLQLPDPIICECGGAGWLPANHRSVTRMRRRP
jgi:hypothetical protein